MYESKELNNFSPHSAELLQWLLLIYRVPSEPSSARSAIWRDTRKLGVLSLQHAVCLLPLTKASQTAFSLIAQKIVDFGGEVTILETISPDANWQQQIIARFNAARNEEYAEVIDETERFAEEIAREKRKGKFTFAELEDEESNLERLKKYLSQVQARDCFGASTQSAAIEAVAGCSAILDGFAQEIYLRQAASDNNSPTSNY